MEFLVQKVGMSRILGTKSEPVTLLRVLEGKVCEVYENNKALVAYSRGKELNKAISGAQKKYNLDGKFNRFVTLESNADSVGDLSLSDLESAQRLKITFKSKGRGFSGVMKRWNFAGGPGAHGSRFHRRPGSIGNREFPGRVQKGKKMPGRFGFDTVTVQNDVISFDKENNILVVKGSVAGHRDAFGKIKIIKSRQQ